MRILIAEDTPILQFLQKTLMARWGYDYDLVADGEEVVRCACSSPERYDLCIMDVSMPKLNGLQAAELIRQNATYFPILGYSSDSQMREPCLRAGMDDFLAKNADSRALYESISSLTVKRVLISCDDNRISLRTETPVTPEELKELRELDKKGLAFLIIENGTQRFVVHKNIQNKMSHALIGDGKELFEFLDRSENPATCHLYKANMQTNRLLLTPEAFSERVAEEDKDIEKFRSPADIPFDKGKG